MATMTAAYNLADFVRDLGDIPMTRIRMRPAPGTAEEYYLLEAAARDGFPCELVDSTLVEKAMGYSEGSIAAIIIRYLLNYLDVNDLGNAAGADGMMRIAAGLVRIPDVSFVRWHKLPVRLLPREAIPGLAPCLAVEVLSESNTPGEMRRKLREYFDAGTEVVWMVDPDRREVRVHTSP